ncbi:MAG: hypothetical protein KF764_16085 [Labilithrix sp.]|nr:hypothetical protein [Labilithrix sp.]MBX3221780.1 hypothetical protein [Labilithrix sp.]
MIGKSLRERWELGQLDADKAVALLKQMLGSHAEPLVEVRRKDARMIACLVVGADKPTLRLCRELGFEMRPGGTGVFGVLGGDAARLFDTLPEPRRAWLEAPCGPRETKVLLVAGGIALLSLETSDGAVTITAVP